MNSKLKIITLFFCFLLFLCMASCKPSSIKDDTKTASENIYAKNFLYQNHKNYTEVHISAGGSEYIWYLYRDKKPSVADNKPSGKNRIIQYVKIPAQRIVSLSSENIYFLESLNSLDKLKAIDLAKNSSNKKVKELTGKGAVAQVGEGRDIDIEALYAINPDLIIIPWTGGDYDSSGLLLKKKFPVAVTAGWLESHPLGRAEWLVFLSLFLGMEEDGKNIFNETVLRYNSLKEKVPHGQEQGQNSAKPVIVANMLNGDIWNVPSGGSYFSTMFEDAGAVYPWTGIKNRGSLFFDFEDIYTTAGNADVWLLNSEGIMTLKDVLNKDKRYSLFRAFQSRRIYNNNLMDKGDGNPFWDEGTACPDRILSDLVKIFYPAANIADNVNNSGFYYFRHVE